LVINPASGGRRPLVFLHQALTPPFATFCYGCLKRSTVPAWYYRLKFRARNRSPGARPSGPECVETGRSEAEDSTERMKCNWGQEGRDCTGRNTTRIAVCNGCGRKACPASPAGNTHMSYMEDPGPNRPRGEWAVAVCRDWAWAKDPAGPWPARSPFREPANTGLRLQVVSFPVSPPVRDSFGESRWMRPLRVGSGADFSSLGAAQGARAEKAMAQVSTSTIRISWRPYRGAKNARKEARKIDRASGEVLVHAKLPQFPALP
jgi:hypothetical protein